MAPLVLSKTAIAPLFAHDIVEEGAKDRFFPSILHGMPRPDFWVAGDAMQRRPIVWVSGRTRK